MECWVVWGQALAIAMPMSGTSSTDVLIWSLLIAVGTAALLWPGRYRLLERIMIVGGGRIYPGLGF